MLLCSLAILDLASRGGPVPLHSGAPGFSETGGGPRQGEDGGQGRRGGRRGAERRGCRA